MNFSNTAPSWASVAHAIAGGLDIAKGEIVSVFLTDASSFAIVEAFCAEVYRRGAQPHIVLTDERIDRLALELATEASLADIPFIESESMSHSSVHVSFRGMIPPAPRASRHSEGVLAQRLALQRGAKGTISGMRWQNTRWAIVRVPTVEWADFMGIPFPQLLEEFFNGCLVDWESERPKWDALAQKLTGTSVVRMVSDDTDLSLRTSGRKAVVFAGEANWPDGEIATAPHNDGVDGYITFPERFYFAGEVIENLRLEFERGEVVQATADRGLALVKALLATDAGARRVGELGIGTNSGMTLMTGDLLFDEKIQGTAHIALGRAYPQCGGTNESSLHWDIVKDLRPGAAGGAGSLFFDRIPVLEHGVPLWR